MSKAGGAVVSLTQQSWQHSSTVSDRPQRMSVNHTWPDDRTTDRADNGRRNILW